MSVRAINNPKLGANMSSGSNIGIRPFDLQRDLPDVKRIWQEVGWVEDEGEIAQLDHFFAVGSTLLGTIDDVAECSVHTVPADVYLGPESLPLCAVTAVTTSRIARGYAFAQRITAKQLAAAAQQGAAVAALGIFDQGFYDKLGFGTGSYDHSFKFDPATLLISRKPATPVRLSKEDYAEMHRCLCERHKVHGSVCLHPPQLYRAELGFEENGFGLGYRKDGQLTHFVWLKPKGERGPYRVLSMAYQNTDQLMELLALLKSLADQVYSVELMEPPEIQLQVLLERPFRNQAISDAGKHEAEHESFAWWQMRILNLSACLAAFNSAVDCRFQLELTDPLEPLLMDEVWQGIAGTYTVQLGAPSQVQAGSVGAAEDMVLRASVNALTRWLWGIQPATSLALTDDFAAPEQLLAMLDQAVVHRDPRYGWDF